MDILVTQTYPSSIFQINCFPNILEQLTMDPPPPFKNKQPQNKFIYTFFATPKAKFKRL